MRKDLVGGAWVALASVQFGVLVVLGKTLADDGFAILSALVLRFAIAAIVLAIGVVLSGGSLRPARGEARGLIALGGIGYAIESSFFFLAIARGTATAVTLLFFSYPVLVMLAAAALGRGMPTWLVRGALVSAVAGTALVIAASGSVDISGGGIAFALGSASMYTLYLLGAERVIVRTPSIVAAMWVSAAASCGIALYTIAAGSAALPHGVRQWGLVAGMGLASAGAFFCLFAGLRLIGAVRAAIVAALEPLSTAALSFVFLDEPLRAGTLAGGALILAGATAAGVARRAEPEPETAVP